MRTYLSDFDVLFKVLIRFYDNYVRNGIAGYVGFGNTCADISNVNYLSFFMFVRILIISEN
jgi:hypothetical protein